MNGKSGDHPLTDILHHGAEVYGRAADELIRQIHALSSQRELNEWWECEIGWSGGPETALEKARAFHAHLVQRAKESGWEVRDI